MVIAMSEPAAVSRRSWWDRHKARVLIVVPFVALSIAAVALVTSQQTRAEQAEVKAEQAAVRVRQAQLQIDLNEAAIKQSCIDRQQARRDGDEILLTIAAGLMATSPRIGEQLKDLIEARPPIECESQP